MAGVFFSAAAFLSQPAPGQQTPPEPQPKPYQAVAVQPPQPYNDASFEAFLDQLADIAEKKNKAALGRIIAQDFFWISDGKDTADKSKPPIENFAKAIGLDGADGWLALEDYSGEETADPYAERAGVICSPAKPKFDQNAYDALEDATDTEADDWGYPVRSGLDVRESAAKNARVIEKLGMNLVWIYPDPSAKDDDETMRIVTPSGKIGYVLAEDIVEIEGDQVCYVKDGNAWKIAGVISSDDGSD
jgi:hypothetical protein